MDMFSPQAITGLVGVAPAAASSVPGIGRSAGPSPVSQSSPWHPDNPMMWLGVIVATTIGLMAVNASVRVGPFRASAGAGKKG